MPRRVVVVLLSVAVLSVTALFAGAGSAVADGGGTSAAGGASATSAGGEVILRRGDRGKAVRRVQRRLHKHADGIFGRRTEGAVKRFQKRHGLDADGVVGPLTRKAMGLDPFTKSSVYRVRLPKVMRLIAECESGGNPEAISSNHKYRGKWQFTKSTWKSLGGKGDPAKASEAEQDRRAMKLYRREGTDPWPDCGAKAKKQLRS